MVPVATTGYNVRVIIMNPQVYPQKGVVLSAVRKSPIVIGKPPPIWTRLRFMLDSFPLFADFNDCHSVEYDSDSKTCVLFDGPYFSTEDAGGPTYDWLYFIDPPAQSAVHNIAHSVPPIARRRMVRNTCPNMAM